MTTAVLERTTASRTTVTQAYTFAIGPTPEQANALASHIGGSRFAYNAMLGLVQTNWDENRAKKETGIDVAQDDWVDTSHFGLLYLWAARRDELAPWWAENGANTYNDAAQRLAKAITNFHKGRSKFPRFKHKGRGGSVRFTNQAVRLTDSHHVRINHIGELKTYESTRKLYRHLERDGQDHGRDRVRAFGHVDGLVQRRDDSTSPRHPDTREDHRRRRRPHHPLYRRHY